MPLVFFLVYIFVLLILIIVGWFYHNETHDLEERNKRLSALRRLDEVMMSPSKGVIEVAQKVTDAMAFELWFENGVLALIDEQKGVLKRVAMSNTPSGIIAKKSLPIPYESVEIPLSCEENISIKVIKTGQKMVTHDLYDLFIPVFDRELSKKIQDTVKVKTSLIYPIKAREKVIGVMIVSVGRMENQLSSYEEESIQDLVNVIGIALDNAMLYENLDTVSKQLQKANIKLMELDQLKDDFVSIASHELRTPMAAIRSYAWMALHKSDVPLSEKVERYLVRTLMSTERLINLVNDMLNISRIEGGKIEINPEPVDLSKLIDDIVDEAYQSKGIEKKIHISVLEERLPRVLADPEKLREVMLNILGNAVKFVPEGGTITISFFTDGKVVETSIKDTGPGISKEDLGKLFRKFGRLDHTYTALSTSGGTGLGLFISKSIIELMHGKIWAESEGLGKGATFTFSLPVATVDVLKNINKYQIKPQGEVKGLEPVAI